MLGKCSYYISALRFLDLKEAYNQRLKTKIIVLGGGIIYLPFTVLRFTVEMSLNNFRTGGTG